MANIGISGLVIILIVILIIFGPKKLPELGRSIGETIKNFKGSTKELREELDEEFKDIEKSRKSGKIRTKGSSFPENKEIAYHKSTKNTKLYVKV